MKILQVQLLLAIAIYAMVGARPTESNCTNEFKSLLDDVLDVKTHCKIKGYYDCCEAKTAAKLAHLHSSASGVYDINDVCSSDDDSETSIQSPLQVRCDMDTDEGGWIVILRRRKDVIPNVNFDRSWDDYEKGFGDLNTEFWLGLRNIHCLTKRDDVDLMIDLRETDGNGMTWIYHKFKVNGSNEKYKLHIGEGEGPPNGYDAMANENEMMFTTRDSDNDKSSGNCATIHEGGWWFNCCYRGFLTGHHTNNHIWSQLLWYNGLKPVQYSNFKRYQNVDMMIRPKVCASSRCTD